MPRLAIIQLVVVCLPALLVQVAPSMASPMNRVEYRVHVPASLDSLRVQACGQSGDRLSLMAPSQQAAALLADVAAEGDATVTVLDGRLQLIGSDGVACLAYQVDLTRAPRDQQWRGGLVVATDAVLLSPGQFLWPPEGHSEFAVEFVMPRDYRVSAPWEVVSATKHGRVFRVSASLGRDDAKIALGQFETYRLGGDAMAIEVAVLRGEPEVDDAMVHRWLTANIDAVSAVQSGFPVPRLQLLVIPIGSGDEPVPWGQVSRDGGDAVHVYIDQRMSEPDFMDDWVLSHELSHLFHPALTGNARWLFEGLASYYQNVSRARVGMLSSQAAWQKLHAGFERGRRGTKPGRTLMHATRAMHAERAYMQVYWSGAALFLLADLELRESTDSQQSLDRVLAAFAGCCLPAERVWTAREFLRRLDRLSGSDVFTRLAATHRDSDRFPDLSAAYAKLGLRQVSGDGLTFDDSPQHRALRDAIMGAP